MKVPAVVIELGYLSNIGDLENLINLDKQAQLAVIILEGLSGLD